METAAGDTYSVMRLSIRFTSVKLKQEIEFYERDFYTEIWNFERLFLTKQEIFFQTLKGQETVTST